MQAAAKVESVLMGRWVNAIRHRCTVPEFYRPPEILALRVVRDGVVLRTQVKEAARIPPAQQPACSPLRWAEGPASAISASSPYFISACFKSRCCTAGAGSAKKPGYSGRLFNLCSPVQRIRAVSRALASNELYNLLTWIYFCFQKTTRSPACSL